MALSGLFVQRSASMNATSCDGFAYDGAQLHVTCGCALHDEERLKELYLGVTAYRKGVSAAVGGLGVWLARVLRTLPFDSVQPGDLLQTTYCSLGLDASMLDT
eukprot:1367998-Amphidinium_carterae.1